jgi:Putative bacterial sensory transduction regulator
MTRQLEWAVPLAGCLLILAATAPAGAQNKEKVYRNLTTAQLETILNDMSIRFTKSQPPKPANDYDYDFERNNYKIKLTLSDGRRVWISAFFPKTALEKINQWNINAKFTRAVLDRVNDREYAIVEYQLDVRGGVTDNMLKQFIKRFDNDVAAFDQFLRNS